MVNMPKTLYPNKGILNHDNHQQYREEFNIPVCLVQSPDGLCQIWRILTEIDIDNQ